MHPYTKIFGVQLPSYSLISLVGFLLAGVVAFHLLRSCKTGQRAFLKVTLCAVVGMFIGAHLLYALTRIEDIIIVISEYSEYDSFSDFMRDLLDNSFGMVFYGGLYGGLLFGFLYAKKRACCLDELCDVFAVCIPLFHTFGRVGCYFAGCCYGVKWEKGIAGRMLTTGVKESAKRFPVQLLEATLLFLLFITLFLLFKKNILRTKLIFVYLLSYAVLRFFTEYMRGDEVRGRLLCFSTSQWISIVTVLWVSVYLIVCRRKSSLV